MGGNWEHLRHQMAEIERQRDQVREFYHRRYHRLGGIIAASGFDRRSPTNGRLDWALLKVPSGRLPARNKVSISLYTLVLRSYTLILNSQ